eukprot:499740_1
METIDELHQEQSIDYEQFIDTTTITVDEHKEQAYEHNNMSNKPFTGLGSVMDGIKMPDLSGLPGFGSSASQPPPFKVKENKLKPRYTYKDDAYSDEHDTVLQLQIKAKEILDQLMVAEKDALKKRKEAIKMNGEVEIEMKAINERTANVEAELAEAKPALEASQK